MFYKHKNKKKDVFLTKKQNSSGTINGRTENSKDPTSSKVRSFLFVCITKRQLVLKENVGECEISSIKKCGNLRHVRRICSLDHIRYR